MVPPDGLAVRVMDWPLSMTGAEGVMAPAERAGLTVAVPEPEEGPCSESPAYETDIVYAPTVDGVNVTEH